MKLYGYRLTEDGETVVHYLSDDEGLIYDECKQRRRSWSSVDGPMLIEAFEIDVDLSGIEAEEYFRGERTADDIRADIEKVERSMRDLEMQKADLLRELVG